MQKILIATKNKDKFEIVTKILNKINNVSYEYYSLYDIKNLEKSDKEENIEVRAYNKANQIYSSIKDNDFKYQKYNENLKIEENSYPLSNVLRPIDSDKTVAQIDKNENNQYYLKYSEKNKRGF